MIAKLFQTLDRKYAFGILTGLLFGLLSVYTDFYRSSVPEIEFEVLSNTTVVDLKERIRKIDILYDNKSILSEKKNLSLITLKISNNGNADVLENFYYKKFPLGFKLHNGELLEMPTIIQTNNDFLSKSILLNKLDSHKVKFNNFIFEKGDYFTIKMLILHDTKKIPQITAEGKIIGVKNIKVLNPYLNKDRNGFWETVVNGSILIHITRFFSYLFIIIFIVVGIMLPISYLGDLISESKRKKIAEEFRKIINRQFSADEQFIIQFYVTYGKYGIESLKRTLARYQKYKHINKLINPSFQTKRLIREINMPYEKAINVLIETLKDLEAISVDNGKLEFKNNLDNFINAFAEFIVTK